MSVINSTQPNTNAFEHLSLEEPMNSDEHKPFFIERGESGLIPTVATEMDNVDMRSASPYAFHYINENLELHRDLFMVANDDEDEGNLRNQVKGK